MSRSTKSIIPEISLHRFLFPYCCCLLGLAPQEKALKHELKMMIGSFYTHGSKRVSRSQDSLLRNSGYIPISFFQGSNLF